jgi:PBP1b-binding outer membrane lipoprotein LpoB
MTMTRIILTSTLLCVALSGCAGFQQTVTGYESAVLKGVQAVEDNNIAVWATNACGTPFSAAIRHPEVVPALRVLCLPAGAASSPVTLLDGITPAK